MKQNFLHFISKVPCLIGINGEVTEKIDNKYIFECDIISNTPQMFVSYTPTITEKNYVPYTYLLETNDIPTTTNKQIKIIPFPDDNYDIIMTPFELTQNLSSQVLCNIQLGKYYISAVSSNTTKVTIFSGASIVFTYDLPRLSKIKIENIHNTIIIEGLSYNNNYELLLINSESFKVIFEGECNSIEKDNEYIQCLKNINDISKTAEVNKINLKTNELEKYYVYQFDKEKTPTNNILIPMNFLQSIQIGDEVMVKKLLSDAFTNTSISTLNNYFGKINEIYPNRHSNKIDILNYTIKGDKYKNYNFIMDNNKIIDIQEVFC